MPFPSTPSRIGEATIRWQSSSLRSSFGYVPSSQQLDVEMDSGLYKSAAVVVHSL